MVETFEAKLLEATTLESECEYAFGPPDIALPSFEQYAFWLLENNRPAEAVMYFDQSLSRAPRRVAALRGKMDALTKLNKLEEAKSISTELKDIWSKADMDALKFIVSI